jgi:hypothetical protein
VAHQAAPQPSGGKLELHRERCPAGRCGRSCYAWSSGRIMASPAG